MEAPALTDDIAKPDRCFRCDYDIRGIADDQPCPECGLTTGLSRQKSDELADASPKWLRRVSRGVRLIVVAWVTAVAVPTWLSLITFTFGPRLNWNFLNNAHATFGVWDLAGLFQLVGVWMISRRDEQVQYDEKIRRQLLLAASFTILPALGILHLQNVAERAITWEALEIGRSGSVIGSSIIACIALLIWKLAVPTYKSLSAPHRKLITGMRLLAAVTALAGLIGSSMSYMFEFGPAVYSRASKWRKYNVSLPDPEAWNDLLLNFFVANGMWIGAFLMLVSLAIVPLLLFAQLRDMARRALNRNLVEHCMIVSVGSSATILLIPGVMIFNWWAVDQWGSFWTSRSNLYLVMWMLLIVSTILFFGWSLLTLARISWEFSRASRLQRRRWRDGDRAVG